VGGAVMYDVVEEKIKQYEKLLIEMWTASEKYLGRTSVQFLLERVVWELSAEYKEIELLYFDENEISCKEILTVLKKNPEYPVDGMFRQFITSYVEILSRLIGSENAGKLMEILRQEMNEVCFDSRKGKEDGKIENGVLKILTVFLMEAYRCIRLTLFLVRQAVEKQYLFKI